MKKIAMVILMVSVLAPASVFAGGIVTNTNQSASFIRMPAQDATISIDGAYYNPAGLIHLEDGFHISLSNQYVTQTRTIESTFTMNQQKFEGDVLAPLFPTFYAVYKKGKTAYSFGINPIGGGGSANFEEGLPSFEQMVAMSNLPGLLSASGIPTSDYQAVASFDGRSLNWGIQFNASYAITEMLSLSLGFRYVIANNSYNGGLNILINPAHPLNPSGSGNMVSAPLFFTTLATAASGAATSIQPIIDNGGGGFTLDQLVAASFISQAQADQLAGGLGASYDPAMTASQVQGAYIVTAATMNGYSEATADKELEATQSGFGISPIIGVNLKLSDNLNVALKYEHKAEITMTNKTVVDDVNMYPNGGKTPNDMPSMLAVGVGYRPIDKLYVSGGFHYYFDKNANYGKKIGGSFVENKEVIDNNFWEAGLGLEYLVTDNFLLSAGFLRTQTGVNEDYHSDLSHSLNTNSIGVGGKYILNNSVGINFGFMTTMYEGYTKKFSVWEETYNRKAMVIALGIDYKF